MSQTFTGKFSNQCFQSALIRRSWTEQRLIDLYKNVFFKKKNRAAGKTGLVESDTRPSIITVTSADESDVDITEAVEKTAGTNDNA